VLVNSTEEIYNGVSVHPEMATSPDIFVARKILSSKYQPFAPKGISFGHLRQSFPRAKIPTTFAHYCFFNEHYLALG
jgi:hypothetical protein